MRRANTVYGLILTYADLPDLDPGEYQRTGKEAVLERYRQITRTHLNALFQSIRRRKGTQKGIDWSARVEAISSCEEGKCARDLLNDKNIPEVIKKFFRHRKRCRLHIHLLVVGEPGATIAQYIKKYWEKRHGIVQMRKFDHADLAWLEEYFASQKLVKRGLLIE